MPDRPALPLRPGWFGAMKSPPIMLAGSPVSACQRMTQDVPEYGYGASSTRACGGRCRAAKVAAYPDGTRLTGAGAYGAGISGSSANTAMAVAIGAPAGQRENGAEPRLRTRSSENASTAAAHASA